jgi:alpha-glucosidase (family GH31 glycosyl hydrolase)
MSLINYFYRGVSLIIALLFSNVYSQHQQLEFSGSSMQLQIRDAGDRSIRVTLMPINLDDDLSHNPVLSDIEYSDPVINIRELSSPLEKEVGNFIVNVLPEPLKIIVHNKQGDLIQELTFSDNGQLAFMLDDQPVLGMGEGGPRMGEDWKNDTIEFDRKGRLHKMEPRWQKNAYGSRNPVAMLVGTGGWGIFVVSPWVQIDLTEKEFGLLIPRHTLALKNERQTTENQNQNLGKGLPPSESVIPGSFDIILFDTNDPLVFMSDLSAITGSAVMPPLWALGYMQSHRTLEDENQMIEIVKTFREKQIPVDAVIYLGTGFCPKGWNTEQPSFDFNPEVFKREPSEVIDDLHDMNVKVIMHIVPWDRDKLPTLHGSIPSETGEEVDESHILTHWKQHSGLVNSNVDAWWPDEGDWFNLHERIKRHQMYYQGPLSTTPNVRPWSLHRNGHLGISQWGGWVWSGDTESSWKTLEGQIAVGINHSLSLSPFWGSDIGGFFPTEELDGELYARWFQFGAFCSSFRSHGRTWWTRLPWGWGLSEMGPKEGTENPLESELNNPEIEIVCRKYAELRYRFLSYNYTLAWESRSKGLPMMRAMWLHYAEDKVATAKGDQYLWGKDMIIAPVYEKGASMRKVYLPEGIWYDWWDNTEYMGGKDVEREVALDIIPIFVRAGAIIPFDPLRQYTSEPVDMPIEIKVFRGDDGSFTMYEDDGISLDYLENKNITLTDFIWNDEAGSLTIEPNVNKGVESNKQRKFKVILLPSKETKTITYNGKSIKVKF